MDIDDHNPGHTNVHAGRSTLPEQYCACTSYNFQLMESQEHGALLRSVHATAGTTTYTFTPACRPVRNNSNDGCRDYNRRSHQRSHRSDLFARTVTAPALTSNIHQRNHRNMEPGNDQHCNSRNNNLYLYTNCRPVRNSSNNGYSDHTPGHTNLYADRTTLPELVRHLHFLATSTNGITGTWSPATINTATVGTTTYTFTPLQVSAATTATMDVVITTQVTPTFTQIGPLCQNSTAPALTCNIHQRNNRNLESGNDQHCNSRNNDLYIYTGCRPVRQRRNDGCRNHNPGHASLYADRAALPEQTAPALPAYIHQWHTGTWSPATINTATVGTTTYTFTPAAGQCGTTATMDVVITTQVTPTFTQIGPFARTTRACISYNIHQWHYRNLEPCTINTATVGTTTYTFTQQQVSVQGQPRWISRSIQVTPAFNADRTALPE